MTENKAKRLIQTLVIAGISLLLVLIIVVVTQSIIKANLERQERLLRAELDKYLQKIETVTDEIEYCETLEYIEKYARELGYIKDGETIFQGK